MFASDRQAGMKIYSVAPTGLSLSRWTTSLGANGEPHLSLNGSVAKSRSLASYRLPGSLYISSRPTGSSETAAPADGTRLVSLTREGADGLAISVQSVVASPGTEVSVTVNLTGAENLGNLAFDLDYDRTKLTLLAVTPGEMLDSGMYAVNPENLPSNSGSLRFNWVTTAGYTGSGTIVTLRFRVADGLDNGETIALPLSNLMTASRDIVELPRSGENGLITLFVQQAMVTGTTWQVNGTILGEVILTLDGGTMITSVTNGSYLLGINTLVEHTVTASEAGYQNQERTINVTDITESYALDFKGDNGLIPSAPDLSYVLACINKWSYPPSDGTELEMPKVLAVINRWKYPILTNPD